MGGWCCGWSVWEGWGGGSVCGGSVVAGGCGGGWECSANDEAAGGVWVLFVRARGRARSLWHPSDITPVLGQPHIGFWLPQIGVYQVGACPAGGPVPGWGGVGVVGAGGPAVVPGEDGVTPGGVVADSARGVGPGFPLFMRGDGGAVDGGLVVQTAPGARHRWPPAGPAWRRVRPTSHRDAAGPAPRRPPCPPAHPRRPGCAYPRRYRR